MQVYIGEQCVGDEQPCYVIAEIGSNHNQDYNLALESIDAAAAAGVNAVKFQTFRAKDHYSKHTPGFTYLDGKNTYDLIQSLELNRDWQISLSAHAKARGVEFLSSPCDFEAINQLSAMDMSAYKVASFDMTDQLLINKMAETGKPMILSTGMASMSDIESAVDTVHLVNNNPVILLQCTSLYPAPTKLSNLNSMKMMRQAFGCLTGYSDHTMGEHIPLAAVAMGACVLEKHFTLDRNLSGPDHPFAIEPEELKSLVTHIRAVEEALGDGIKNGPREAEKEMYDKGRRSIHAAVNINTGEKITSEMISIKRPGYGMPPRFIEFVIGRTAKEDIKADYWITQDMI
jgi:sialic acid synthase SpsE